MLGGPDLNRWTIFKNVCKLEMLSLAGLEEARHYESDSCKKMNSANTHVNLEKDSEPQIRTQPWPKILIVVL